MARAAGVCTLGVVAWLLGSSCAVDSERDERMTTATVDGGDAATSDDDDGDDDDDDDSTGDDDDGSTDDDDDDGDDDDDDDDDGDDDDDDDDGALPAGLEDVGSLVILGDSIGDGGGIGPYYYELLRTDLDAHYGGIEYVNRAEGGSETDALVGQVNGLPGSLPGPVAVVITSGGNDMKANILSVVAGLDGPMKEAMQANIQAAHDALLAPGRFGPDVEVYVFEGNIYDASGGIGDFGMNDCAFGSGFPVIPTDPFFDGWNSAIEQTVAANGQTYVDMHGEFYDHGYHAPEMGEVNWFHTDCTHPNAAGHDALAGIMFEHITGEPG